MIQARLPASLGPRVNPRKIKRMQEGLRRKRALAAVRAAGVDGLLVTGAADVRYLSGFTGSSGAVVIAARRAALFTDGRYTTQAKSEVCGLTTGIGKGAPGVLGASWLAAAGVTRCAFDSTQTTVASLEAMRRALPSGARRSFFQPLPGFVPALREIKDEAEIASMRRAAVFGCKLFEQIAEEIVPGVRETDIALRLEHAARGQGAEGMSFETIVAAGQRSALPHGRASAARLPRRGFCTLDFGIVLNGYCSDMTRTVHLGRATPRERAVYHSVLEAEQAAIAAVAPGVTCGEVDEAARAVLRKAKLDRWFTHSTGHGVGLEIHEGPRVAARQTQHLEPGMVITIEPGVYLPGEFGIRIEDMVLVTERGREVLTRRCPTALIEL